MPFVRYAEYAVYKQVTPLFAGLLTHYEIL